VLSCESSASGTEALEVLPWSATVTMTDVNYHGSITIDSDLLKATGLLPNEAVIVADCDNGARFETYIIPGERGSGAIILNGATAHLGKPVGWVDYKHDINPELVRAILAFHTLGLLNPDHKMRIGVTQLSFRDAFLAVIPEPSTLIGPMGGALGIVVEVRGTKPDGTKGAVRASLMMEHREANRRRGTTAERFLTAAASAAAMVMIPPKRVPRVGVLAPEALSPDLVVPELETRGVKFRIEDLAA